MRSSKIYLLNVIIVGLFGWAMVTYYDAAEEIKTWINDSSVQGFSLNILPTILVLLVAGIAVAVVTRKQRKQGKGWKEALFLPAELKESDEREKMITAKACRNAYVSTMIAFPFLTIGMAAQPLVSDYFAAYPVVVFLLFPFIQMTAYYLTLKKGLS
ncbi:hypothetical protein [Melghirimyces algeriensis]|uniref:PEP-CTERM protein-sorting domain-containing protein n=1 Tax=Melghirimyces algeriensis TaxID=910412 RepID=A0A521DJU6_9BACL|nr:hypothetical protein [Melghirimyces algeriensis]SMO71967.1 PEP-CTERM protein-sorting domain-containing protein [Melghirimyces algeriensis]